MSNRFTERAQRIVLIAQEEAKRLNHDYVGTEHILLGLIALGEGVAIDALAQSKIDLRDIRIEVERLAGTGTAVMLLGEIPFTPRSRKVLQLAVEAAQNMGLGYVGTECLFMGLVNEGEGLAYRVLDKFGIKTIVENIHKILGIQKSPYCTVQNPPSSREQDPARSKLTMFIYGLIMAGVPLPTILEGIENMSDFPKRNLNMTPYCEDLADSILS